MIVLLSLCPGLFAQNVLAASLPFTGKVLRVYDGDTIKVEKVGKVRLLGIDAPEREASERDRYYLRKGISEPTLRRIAAESRDYIARNVVGQSVTLIAELVERDKHDRFLAYVYLPDGRLLNQILLEQGLVTVYRRFAFGLKSEFVDAENVARDLSRGIWVDLKGEKK